MHVFDVTISCKCSIFFSVNLIRKRYDAFGGWENEILSLQLELECVTLFCHNLFNYKIFLFSDLRLIFAYDLENQLGTSAAPCQGVVCISWTAQRLGPVCGVLLILDHSTDVDQLKGALVQESVCVGWNRTVICSQPTNLKALGM